MDKGNRAMRSTKSRYVSIRNNGTAEGGMSLQCFWISIRDFLNNTVEGQILREIARDRLGGVPDSLVTVRQLRILSGTTQPPNRMFDTTVPGHVAGGRRIAEILGANILINFMDDGRITHGAFSVNDGWHVNYEETMAIERAGLPIIRIIHTPGHFETLIDINLIVVTREGEYPIRYHVDLVPGFDRSRLNIRQLHYVGADGKQPIRIGLTKKGVPPKPVFNPVDLKANGNYDHDIGARIKSNRKQLDMLHDKMKSLLSRFRDLTADLSDEDLASFIPATVSDDELPEIKTARMVMELRTEINELEERTNELVSIQNAIKEGDRPSASATSSKYVPPKTEETKIGRLIAEMDKLNEQVSKLSALLRNDFRTPEQLETIWKNLIRNKHSLASRVPTYRHHLRKIGRWKGLVPEGDLTLDDLKAIRSFIIFRRNITSDGGVSGGPVSDTITNATRWHNELRNLLIKRNALERELASSMTGGSECLECSLRRGAKRIIENYLRQN